MYSYRPETVFHVNAAPHVALRSLPGDAGHYLVVDDFYADPLALRRLLLSTPYPAWERDTSGANLVDYSDCRQTILLPFAEPQYSICELAARYLGIRVEALRNTFVTNLFRNHREPSPGAQPRPHDDGICLAAIVMLNIPDECAGGTAFYRCRSPDLAGMPRDPTQYAERRRQVYTGPRAELQAGYFLEHWSEHWKLLDAVEMRFNRLLIYPGMLFHGHWHVPGSFREHWRINQALFFDQLSFDPDAPVAGQ